MGVQAKDKPFRRHRYCLMGLFDVNVPLLYGEEQKAFIKLQHGIIKAVDDEFIFTWKDDYLLQSGMFASSPVAFAGRKDIIYRTFGSAGSSRMLSG